MDTVVHFHGENKHYEEGKQQKGWKQGETARLALWFMPLISFSIATAVKAYGSCSISAMQNKSISEITLK